MSPVQSGGVSTRSSDGHRHRLRNRCASNAALRTLTEAVEIRHDRWWHWGFFRGCCENLTTAAGSPAAAWLDALKNNAAGITGSQHAACSTLVQRRESMPPHWAMIDGNEA